MSEIGVAGSIRPRYKKTKIVRVLRPDTTRSARAIIEIEDELLLEFGSKVLPEEVVKNMIRGELKIWQLLGKI
ncbi:MAG: hypothetical protein JKY54_16855 [Flavobacteriales bacterium]|nr:hypothetical protein [Flavobacteriales bacterium]